MTDTITMTIPAVRAYFRLPRIAIAGIATRSGFSFDEVEDLRLAVGEVCLVLTGPTDGDGTLVINFDVGTRGVMTVDVTADVAAPAVESDSLPARLIEATVGPIQTSDEGRRITFRKVTDEVD